MKTRVCIFYVISILSLLLFAISPSTSSSSFDGVIPDFRINQVLIESADHLMNAKQ